MFHHLKIKRIFTPNTNVFDITHYILGSGQISQYLCISDYVDGIGNKTRIKNNRNALFRLPMENLLNVIVLKCTSKAQDH